jgi:ribose transport system substrate-binding protein
MNKFIIAAGTIAGIMLGASAVAQTKPTIPVIGKDLTSPYWQAVLAGARKAGQDLGVNVVGFGDSDASKQTAILATVVASNPAAIVIAPADFKALGKPIDEAAKKVKIIGIESAADTKAMTSLLATDNLNAGRIAADALAMAITKSYASTCQGLQGGGRRKIWGAGYRCRKGGRREVGHGHEHHERSDRQHS